MPYETPRPLRPGSMPRWSDVNDANNAIHDLGESSSAFGSDLAIERNSGQLQVNDYSTGGHFAQITGVSGGLYSHVQVEPDGTPCAAALPYYFGGTTSGSAPARELNGATVPTGAIVWLEIDTKRRGWVFVYGASGAVAPTGFYAKLTGGTGPYSWTECTVSGGTIGGARTGSLNATEATTGLTGIPVDGSVIVWMSGSGSSYSFNAKMFTLVTSWSFSGSGSSCTITPATTKTVVISGMNLCGSTT